MRERVSKQLLFIMWYTKHVISAVHTDRMLEAGKAKQSKQVMTIRCFGLLQQPHCRHQCNYADAGNAKYAIVASEGCARTYYATTNIRI